MKRTLSSLDVRAIVGELQWCVGSIVDKAYQVDHETVVLRMRKPGRAEDDPHAGRFDLLLRASAWFCATTRENEMPVEPTGFAMNLRKNLGGGTLASLAQVGFDRVVELAVLRGRDTLRVVVELIPEGNVVLVGPDGRILQSLTSLTGKRVVKARVAYAPPPPRPDPTTMDYEAFALAVRGGEEPAASAPGAAEARGRRKAPPKDVVRAVAAVGLGGPLAEELLTRARLDKHTPVAALLDTHLHALYDAWRTLLDRIARADLEPALRYADGAPRDVAPFPMATWEGDGETVPAATFSEALDRYWHELPSDAPREPAEAEKRLEKLQRQVEHQRVAIAEHDATIERDQAAAEALYVRYAEADAALAAAREGTEHPLLAERRSPEAATLRLRTAEGAEVEAAVDPRLDVNENARLLYERAKKAREKGEGARVALRDTEAKVRAAQREVAEEATRAAEAKAAPRTRERRFWFENFRWFHASTGHLVVAGRDAPSNEKAVKKYLGDGDRYAHADVHGAPSVVVKKDEGGVPAEALDEACRFAASMSKAWSHTTVCDAYWVNPEQVSKSPQPGEYVARGAFIIRGERNWLRNAKLELAVGVVHLSPQGAPLPPEEVVAPTEGAARGPVRKVMGGPPAALRRWSRDFVVVEPGAEPRHEAARRLAKRWGVGDAEVERALPPGPLREVTP